MMAAFSAIAAIGNSASVPGDIARASAPNGPNASGFADLLASGLRDADAKVAKADALIQAYALGDAVPVHQVTLAIQQARMSVEMATEVRSKLVDTYHDFLNMQL